MNGDEEKGTATQVSEVYPTLRELFGFKWLNTLTAALGLSAIAMLPLFLVAGSLGISLFENANSEYIAADIGGEDSYTWLATVYNLALAAVAPSAGILSDKIGRRYLALTGPLLIITGMAVFGTAQTMPVAIGGMAIAGAGGGISQTIGVAGVAEIVPVKHRGKFLGTVYLCFSPMAAAPSYGTIPFLIR